MGVCRQAEEGREHRGLSHRHRGEDQLLAAAGGQGDEDLRVAHGAGQSLGRGAVKLLPLQGEGQVQLGDLEHKIVDVLPLGKGEGEPVVLPGGELWGDVLGRELTALPIDGNDGGVLPLDIGDGPLGVPEGAKEAPDPNTQQDERGDTSLWTAGRP